MEKLYKTGRVRSIGVCNFTKHKLSELLKRLPEERPHTVQNEFHPHLPQWDLVEYCNAEGEILPIPLQYTLRGREKFRPT